MEGKNLKPLNNETGGHRIQRIPPTERNGRVHTSTVTVAVLNSPCVDVEFPESEFRVEWFKGSGKGGQHRNKHANSARVIHIPTGMKQERQGRSREQNYNDAKNTLVSKLLDIHKQNTYNSVGDIRSKQIGSGMRGDKRRTYRFKDDQVIDHYTNKRLSCSRIMKGYFNEIH